MADETPTNVVPAWILHASQIITQVGVPTVFACVLLWWVLSSVGKTMEKIVDEEKERTVILVKMQGDLLLALQEQTERFEKIVRENMDLNRMLAGERRRDGRESQGTDR